MRIAYLTRSSRTLQPSTLPGRRRNFSRDTTQSAPCFDIIKVLLTSMPKGFKRRRLIHRRILRSGAILASSIASMLPHGHVKAEENGNKYSKKLRESVLTSGIPKPCVPRPIAAGMHRRTAALELLVSQSRDKAVTGQGLCDVMTPGATPVCVASRY